MSALSNILSRNTNLVTKSCLAWLFSTDTYKLATPVAGDITYESLSAANTRVIALIVAQDHHRLSLFGFILPFPPDFRMKGTRQQRNADTV